MLHRNNMTDDHRLQQVRPIRDLAGIGLGCILIAIALILAACESQPRSAPAAPAEAAPQVTDTGKMLAGRRVRRVIDGPPAQPASSGDDQIRPGDLLHIKVFDVPELSGEERVGASGLIVLPLIKAVPVGGLSPSQASTLIASRYAARWLNNPEVDVDIIETQPGKVSILGAVNEPGFFDLDAQGLTLTQAITRAKGLDKDAKPGKLVLLRPLADDNLSAYRLDLRRIMSGEIADPRLIAGDVVVLPRDGTSAAAKQVIKAVLGVITIPLL